jgi:hypothetical protein
VPFSQQPAVGINDAYGNLRTTDNSTVITVARNAGSGTLQGTLSATAVNGVATFVNLSHDVANTINLSFSGSGLTNVTSANIVVSPAAFSQLQLLVPGETAAPGTVSGKTGTPSAQTAATGFGVTVNAVDSYWNLVNTVNASVGLNSSDATATLPSATAMAGGTANLTVSLNATGNFTITATDLTDGSKSANTSPTIIVGSADVLAQPATLTSLQVVANGISIVFSGTANQTYQIQRASALQTSGTVWTNIGSATTDADGHGQFTDTNPPPAQGFYRTASH